MHIYETFPLRSMSLLRAPAVSLLVTFRFPTPASPTLAYLVWRTICLGAMFTGGDVVTPIHDTDAGGVAAEFRENPGGPQTKTGYRLSKNMA